MRTGEPAAEPSLTEVMRQWGRIGSVGFGGPPAHIALFHELCVERRGWLTDADFERALAAVNLLPGPASTQLAIYCAWRLRGPRGALVGGVCFIAPGLVLILVLSALFLSRSAPTWVRGAGLGAGAAVAAVAVRAGLAVARPIWSRAGGRRARVLAYGAAGGVVAAVTGAWLVLVLVGCGALELARTPLVGGAARLRLLSPAGIPALAHRRLGGLATALARGPLLAAGIHEGGVGALAWTALKVGALSFGGGFVIVPLMQADAVNTYHWMTHGQFLNAVALGQVTPGPVLQTVAAVGYAAGGVPDGLLAAAVAFAPSFSFVLLGAARFQRLLADQRVSAFLAGASPAAAGAIIGSAVPLASALSQPWQYALLAGAAFALLVLRRGVVQTLLAAGAVGTLAALLGASIPY
jgi:chromate transporter